MQAYYCSRNVNNVSFIDKCIIIQGYYCMLTTRYDKVVYMEHSTRALNAGHLTASWQHFLPQLAELNQSKAVCLC